MTTVALGHRATRGARTVHNGPTDNMEAGIERWLFQSGLTEISVASLRPVLPRWAEFLRQNGVTTIPEMPARDAGDWYSTDLLCLQVKQAMAERDAAQEHNLRNLTRIRPFKP